MFFFESCENQQKVKHSLVLFICLKNTHSQTSKPTPWSLSGLQWGSCFFLMLCHPNNNLFFIFWAIWILTTRKFLKTATLLCSPFSIQNSACYLVNTPIIIEWLIEWAESSGEWPEMVILLLFTFQPGNHHEWKVELVKLIFWRKCLGSVRILKEPSRGEPLVTGWQYTK